VTIVQSRVEMSYQTEGADTLWTTIVYDSDGFVIDSLASRTYQLTALAWRDGQVVACGGDCSGYSGVQEIDYQQAMTQIRSSQ